MEVAIDLGHYYLEVSYAMESLPMFASVAGTAGVRVDNCAALKSTCTFSFLRVLCIDPVAQNYV